jgi:inorganic pyrophosphatase
MPTEGLHRAVSLPADLPMHSGGHLVVVIETPSGSGNKLKFDTDLGVYRLDRVLPAGMTFPFDFGFIPETLAADGDPLDAIVLLDAPVHSGCIVLARLIGVIEAEQRGKGHRTWERNDRLVAVAGGPKGHASIHSLDDVDPFRLKAIESFFANYHSMDGDEFRVTSRAGVRAAEAAIRRAHGAFMASRGDGQARSAASA